MISLGKDLTTQSEYPVWAIVVATDTAECCDFGFRMTAGLCWKGELCSWLDTVAVRYVSHGTTFSSDRAQRINRVEIVAFDDHRVSQMV